MYYIIENCHWQYKIGEQFPRNAPQYFTSCVDDFCVYNLGCRRPNIVHLPHPHHRIIGFQYLGNALGLGNLPNNGIQPFLGLLVNIGKIAVQLAAQLQAGVEGLAVLPDVPQVPLTPQTNGLFFFLWQGQSGDVIVSLPLIPQTVALVIDILFHKIASQFW